MKTLYFDCSSGISGNMTLGALLEIVGDSDYLISELKKLNIDEYEINISKKIKNGITGTYVDVILKHQHSHVHHHEHTHDHRNLDDIYSIIDNSQLDENTKNLAKKIFMRVAKAESKVHNKPLSEIHFHEVGATDSIVDIVGTAILINKINPDKIISSDETCEDTRDANNYIEENQIAGISKTTGEDGTVVFDNLELGRYFVDVTSVSDGAIYDEYYSDFLIDIPMTNAEGIGWD